MLLSNPKQIPNTIWKGGIYPWILKKTQNTSGKSFEKNQYISTLDENTTNHKGINTKE